MNEGILIVDKPNGMTSHDVVAKVRRKFKIRRVGHAGTLDPMATGVLVLLLGKATKLFTQFVAFDKAYEATMILGRETTSADTQGDLVRERPFGHITREKFEAAFRKYVGETEQVPPMVSAVRHKGQKLYQLARKGIHVERTARRIRIDCLRVEAFNPPEVKFYLECSKGTYVRQLADDIGRDLGCGACISQIRRTRVGRFHLKDAVALEALNESHIRHWPGKESL